MKKELRKIGFILVAATSMFAFSCGGAEEPTTETPPVTPEVEEPVVTPEPEPVPADTMAACDESGACDAAPATH